MHRQQGPTTPLRRPEPVFRTPMTFSPRITAEGHKPSPSRVDIWRAELGLEDEPGEDYGSSEEELERETGNGEVVCTAIEFQTLSRELQERDKQRDELLYKIKCLTDKTKQYKGRLQKEESNKKQQIKIMRKTHEANLNEKNELIKNLEEVTAEQETQIYQLQAELNGESSVDTSAKPSSSMPKLIEQIRRLQTEKAELVGQLLTAQHDLETRLTENEETKASLRVQIGKIEKENQSLQDEVIQLRGDKGSNTDNEKQLRKLEEENDHLQRELNEARRLQPKLVHDASIENTKLKKLQEENEKLKDRVINLETDIAIKSKEVSDLEVKHKQEMKRLQGENQGASRQLRELKQNLLSQQAKEPEVITKVEKVTVEVESEASKKALQQANAEAIQLRGQISTYQKMYNDSNKQLTSEKLKTTDLEKRLTEYEQQMEIVKSELMREVEQLEHDKTSALTKAEQEAELRMRSLSANFTKTKLQLQMFVPAFRQLVHDYKSVKKQVHSMPQTVKQISTQAIKEVTQSIREVSEHNKELVRKYKKEMALRKKYHNELVELKGNIRVFGRVRPKIKEDGTGPPAQNVVSYDPDDDGLIYVTNKGRMQTIELDCVFTQESTQIQVFNEVQALVTSCVDGYNVCIFAYGQTGSGKTYTMEGPDEDPGINQRALQELFRETADRALEWNYEINVSVLEIYNEMIRDLLSSDPTYKLEVKLNQEGKLHVPGLKVVKVETVEDVNRTFQLGHENRATATTNMNEHSSRSHALLCVNVVGTNKTTGAKTLGKLNLVDLAGSERVKQSGADGARLKEAQNINRSLSSLGDVIQALRNKQNHIPFRNSKLTYLLQDSLGGDSKTLMIVQIAPVEKNVNETLSSLNFAQRVRTVELGMASKKTESAELVELKDRLAQYEGTPARSGTPTGGKKRK